MNLPFFKRFKKKIIPKYFLVLVLRDEKAEAVVFEELEGIAKIIGQKEEQFSTSIDQITQEELLEKLDKAISSAETSLPPNIQTQKTVFGVKETWTDNDQIKKEYLTKLKKTSEELGLVPIGFLVISQAISHLLQKEEGVPVSAILTEVNKKTITVTLLRAGKSIETKSSEIHDSIPFTVDTLLKHFNVPEILPSRVIVFNGKEDLSQEFISHTWSKSLPFLHIPQITTLPEGFDARSVLFGAATQMGFEVLENDIPRGRRIEHKQSEEIPKIDEKPIEKPEIYKNLGASDFGFAKDIDVAKMEFKESVEIQPEEKPEPKQETLQISTEDFETKVSKPSNNFLSIIGNVLSGIFGAFRKIDFRFMPTSGGKLRIIVPAILVLIILIFFCYSQFMKATITVTVKPIISEKDKSVIFSTTKDTDPSKNTIKGTFIAVSEEGSVSTSTTGKKDVGTSAKGSVTIFSSLTQNKTLTEGTIIKSPNGLAFTLDSNVTIKAVASHSADETVTPEKTTANVTANQLGKESNLPSGTKFTISSYDTTDLIAKNDNPFSGGTKKEVTVASKNDSTKLETDLIKQLESDARKDLEKQLNDDQILLSAFISETLSQKSLNAKIGDEVNQLTLNGTVKYQGLSYNKKDLITLSKSLLSKDIPFNQEVDYNNIKTTVLDMKEKEDEEIEANLSIKALLLPKVSENSLTKDVKGKSFKDAEDIIYKLPQVEDVVIKLSPNLPFLPKKLPGKENNIKILIKING